MPKRILITAGPTREMFDPVRFLSNRSTGQMGYTLAEVAKSKKYQVTLVSGPTDLKPPKGVRFISITSAEELQKVCHKELSKHDALVMSAAVCDYTASRIEKSKIRRHQAMKLVLKQTPDIVASLAKKKGSRTVIGFCLETNHWIENAKKKCRRKGLDGIVANYLTSKYIPFGKTAIEVALVDRANNVKRIKRVSKKQVAVKILNWLEVIESQKGEVKKRFRPVKKRL